LGIACGDVFAEFASACTDCDDGFFADFCRAIHRRGARQSAAKRPSRSWSCIRSGITRYASYSTTCIRPGS